MDKLLTQATQLLTALQGTVDQIRTAIAEADVYHATLQPKLAEVARLDAALAEKTEALSEVSRKLVAASADYEALRNKLL